MLKLNQQMIPNEKLVVAKLVMIKEPDHQDNPDNRFSSRKILFLLIKLNLKMLSLRKVIIKCNVIIMINNNKSAN